MGLDQMAFFVHPQFVISPTQYYPGMYELGSREIYSWNGHPSLQRWMAELWSKETHKNPGTFNLDDILIRWQDIEQLRGDIQSGALYKLEWQGEKTPNCEAKRENDLEFCDIAEEAVTNGRYVVYYWSSW